MRYRIVETDNHNGDYPDEKVVTNVPVFHSVADAERVADAINSTVASSHSRYWKVVDENYVLQPGFEP
jgi:hypothetical protein